MKSQVLPASHTHWPFAQTPLHELSGSQVTWQGGAPHEKRQLLPLPQMQVPFAQTASQSGLSPSQVTWHGGAVQ